MIVLVDAAVRWPLMHDHDVRERTVEKTVIGRKNLLQYFREVAFLVCEKITERLKMTPGRDVHLKRIAGEERNVRRKGLVRRDDPLFELQLLHKDVAHQTAPRCPRNGGRIDQALS